MSNEAYGIITSATNRHHVEGMDEFRPIGAFSFLSRYRVIDFPISNLSNSDIDRIQIYINSNPRSIIEHIGTGRHYNINSKRGKLQCLFTKSTSLNDIYNTDVESYLENLDFIERMHQPYVVITPSYMVFKQNFETLLEDHIESGADITMLYHKVDNARECFRNCDILNLNRQKGVLSIEQNLGNANNRNIFMDTYVMKNELFIQLIKGARKESSAFTLRDYVSQMCTELDVRGIAHKGYFHTITSLKDYYDANNELLDINKSRDLFKPDWPIYTKTTDSCPTQYFETAEVRNSMIANGCLIEGTVENCILGRGVQIKKGAVVKNSIVLSYSIIDSGVHVENQIVDKWAKVSHVKEIISNSDTPGYVRRNDTV